MYYLYRDDCTERWYITTDVTFLMYRHQSLCFVKTETKIEHPLRRKKSPSWWLICFRCRRLCLSSLQWRSQARPAIVGSHRAYPFRLRNKCLYQRRTNDNDFCRGIILQYPMIHICHDPLLASTYYVLIQLTSSYIAVSITAVYAFPFRVASMSGARNDHSRGLPTCL